MEKVTKSSPKTEHSMPHQSSRSTPVTARAT